MKILVTGGLGTVGSGLIRELQERVNHVVSCDIRHAEDEAVLEFVLRLKLTCPRTMIRVAILDEAATPAIAFRVHGSNDELAEFRARQTRVTVPLGVLDLNAGKFDVLIAVQDVETKRILARVQGCCPFAVEGVPDTYAKVVRTVSPLTETL